jgi:hypothetical protein
VSKYHKMVVSRHLSLKYGSFASLTHLREDHAFDMDSEWWDRPAYEPCPRRRSGLLGDAEYDYNADPYP